MARPASLLKPVLFGRESLITYAVMLFYILFPGILINSKLIVSSFSEGSSAFYLFTLILSLVEGYLSIFQPLELVLYLLTALLLGVNITLIIRSLSLLKKQKSLTLSIGGVTMVALIGTGCASCGISLLSLFGVSSAFLPFHGVMLYLFSSALLFISLLVSAKAYQKACSL